MADRANVVVIGGGILGASAAYHLREVGEQDVLLLERDDLAVGTSHAGGGFVAAWAAGYVAAWGEEELEHEQYGIAFYRRLAARGHDIRLRTNGNLWAATTTEHWDKHLEMFVQRDAVRQELLDGSQVEQLTRLIPHDRVVGGIYQPDGIHVSAPLAARAIASEFAARGGRVQTRCPVEALIVRRGKIAGVRTQLDTIETDTVVLAAGAWSNALLRPIGHWLPMVPLTATRITTDPVGAPTEMPTVMLPEYSGIWIREQDGGLCWGCAYETAPRYAYLERDPGGRFDDLPLDGVFETQRVGSLAAQTLPALAQYRSIRIAQGAPCYTSDLRAIIGALQGIEGLYVIGGCNEAGITHAPGMGKTLAGQISQGSAAVNDERWSVERLKHITSPTEVVNAMRRVEGSAWPAEALAAEPT